MASDSTMRDRTFMARQIQISIHSSFFLNFKIMATSLIVYKNGFTISALASGLTLLERYRHNSDLGIRRIEKVQGLRGFGRICKRIFAKYNIAKALGRFLHGQMSFKSNRGK